MTADRRRRTSPTVLRAAWWALRAHAETRAQLRQAGRVLGVTVRPPPASLPLAATRGVSGVLRRRRATCLERSLVRQAWLAAHGHPYAVVIGVTAPGNDFEAHAWLDGLDVADAAGPYQELLRLPPPGAPPAPRASADGQPAR